MHNINSSDTTYECADIAAYFPPSVKWKVIEKEEGVANKFGRSMHAAANKLNSVQLA